MTSKDFSSAQKIEIHQPILFDETDLLAKLNKLNDPLVVLQRYIGFVYCAPVVGSFCQRTEIGGRMKNICRSSHAQDFDITMNQQ